MDIELRTIDCLSMNAKMVEDKIAELPLGETGVVKFSLDLRHPNYVEIKKDDTGSTLYYYDMDVLVSSLRVTEGTDIRAWLKMAEEAIS